MQSKIEIKFRQRLSTETQMDRNRPDEGLREIFEDTSILNINLKES